MANKMSIEGPVKVQTINASPAQVAFNLMQYLANVGSTDQERNTRKFWLTLYIQCYKATSGNYSLESILKED